MSFSIYKIIATVFFIGYCPVAPGTVATAFAMSFLFVFKPDETIILLILLFSLILGTIASENIAKQANEKDPSYIVVDEIAGYFTTIALLPINWQTLLLGFVLFRLFDILKPPPIKHVERLRGGVGIMIDDFLSGLISNLLIRVFLLL